MKNFLTIASVTSLTICLAFFNAYATTINVPGDQATIQAGIDAASTSDTVLVASDDYLENINFGGKDIVVGSWYLTTGDTNYINSTVIDGDESGSVVTFGNNESLAAKLVGFTIQNGHSKFGGGIICTVSHPTITHNKIINNVADTSGGGIYIYDFADPAVTYNTIQGNVADSSGGGIFSDEGSTPDINNNLIDNNQAKYGGGLSLGGEPYEINNNIFSNNTASAYGGGILIGEGCSLFGNLIINNHSDIAGGLFFSDESELTIDHCTFYKNTAASDAAGFYCYESPSTITNSIFWENRIGIASSQIVETNSTLSISYCNIQNGGWAGTGNIDDDPGLCDADNGDFTLYDTSVCVGTGFEGENIGAFGVGCTLTDIEIDLNEPTLPSEFQLMQNYPNPFNPATNIKFSLPRNSFVTLSIYNLLGQKIETLLNQWMEAGSYNYDWDGKNMASGIYFYRIEAGDFADTKKMILLK